LDEAQYTKNHQSMIYQCARRLRVDADDIRGLLA
jgi:hypothetical protein